ncbi:MAG: hypothetical protein IPF78_11240 [Flavobacteriales bacterium]|nr:hypothetical protein [Flavobacteriales bacterium]
MERTLPDSIRSSAPMGIGEALSERELLEHMRELGAKNKLSRSYIGLGYSGTITPSVIRRNVFENPGWYTAHALPSGRSAKGAWRHS